MADAATHPEGSLLERLRFRAMSAKANNQGITAAILVEAADEIEALYAKVNEDRLTRWALRGRLDRALGDVRESGHFEGQDAPSAEVSVNPDKRAAANRFVVTACVIVPGDAVPLAGHLAAVVSEALDEYGVIKYCDADPVEDVA